MERPFLTVVTATQGRKTLPAALESFRRECADPALLEVLVVVDTHDPPFSDVHAIAQEYDARCIEYDAGCHAFGHPQAQRGTEKAYGQWIAFIGDDDEILPGAFEAIKQAIKDLTEPRPLMFKTIMEPSLTRPIPQPMTLWYSKTLTRGHISAQNLVTPNLPGKLGFWWDDFAFIQSTASLHGGPSALVWLTPVIAVCH
jgi:hypothetical protein